jgi:RimJ/RimL family protein N-acetyltransferase
VIEVIETERLRLSPFTVEDVEAAFRWFGDPEVMRFVPGGPDPSIEATRGRVERYRQHQAVHGFSKWVIRQRESAEPIGDSGLVVLDGSEAVDLGFRLGRPYWGRGLATEAATAWLHAAFVDLGLRQLTAFTHPGNVASVRVLRKVAFSLTGARQVLGMDALTFSAAAGEAVPRPDFTGTWRFNPAKSSLQIRAPDETLFVIDHRDPALHISRTHRIGERQDTFSLDLTTDGSEIRVDRAGLRLRARATWEGDGLVFDTRLLRTGEEATNVVRYSLSRDGELFLAEERFRSGSLNYDNTWLLDRVASG